MLEREYVVFISYRHKPLDIDIAKRLHRLIEHYRVPKDLRKGDSGRLGYVFRDRDELPLSSDLSSDIKSALDRSGFLLVICTPDTPKSAWVGREIEYFLENHDRSRALAVLADGTPEEAFPKQLTHIYEADGVTLSRIIEPLAANVVSPLRIKRNLLVKEEFLRLAAAILECPYDMLRQREKRYRQQRVSMAAAVVAVTAVGFSGVVMQKNGEIQRQNAEILAKSNELQARNDEIERQNEEIQTQHDEIERQNEEIQAQLEQSLKNESQALALVSGQLLDQGDRMGAVENALDALPSHGQERPESVEAELALCNALYVYQDEEMRAACRVEQETEIQTITVSQGAGRVATLDQYDCLRCFDGYTGELLWKREVASCFPDCFTVIESKQAIFYAYNNQDILLLSLEDGTVLEEPELHDRAFTGSYVYGTAVSADQEVIATWRIGSEKENEVSFYRMSDFGEISTVAVPEYTGFSRYDCWSEDGTRYAAAFKDTKGEDYVYSIYVFDIPEGRLLYHMSFDPYGASSYIGLVFLPDNDLMVLRSNSYPDAQYLYRLDGETGRIEYRQSFAEEYPTGSSQTLLWNEGMLVCPGGRDVLVFDLETGSLLEHQVLPFYCEACYWLEDDRQEYVAVLSSGEVITENLSNYDASQPHKDPVRLQTGVNVSEAYGNSMGTDYVCVLPENEKYHALIYRPLGDEQKKELSVPVLTKNDRAFQCPWGELHPFPSGDRALYFVDEEQDRRNSTVIIYDALEEEARYGFYHDNALDFVGFSREETKLLFTGGIFDLESEIWMPYLDAEGSEVTGLEFQEPYIQEAGTSVQAVLFRDEDYDGFGTLHWWEDGEEAGEGICPYEGKVDSRNRAKSIAMGGSGLIGIAFGEDLMYPNRPKGYAVYSRERAAWSYLPNPCEAEGFPIFCVGNRNPWLAFCDYDRSLRIVNGETGETVRTFPLEIAADAVNEMQFLLDDKVLLMRQNHNRLCILDTEDGNVKNLLNLEDCGEYDRLSIQLDAAGGNLYIGEHRGGMEGICIDLSTWEVRSRIPGLAIFAPRSRQIIKKEDKIRNWEHYVSYPAYSLEELVEKGEKLLGISH